MKMWKALPLNIKSSTHVALFKTAIKNWNCNFVFGKQLSHLYAWI